MRTYVVLILALAIKPATAQVSECDTDAVSIFYVNGMFNDRHTTFTSLTQLARHVDAALKVEGKSESFRRKIRYKKSHNQSESWYLQILELSRQVESDIDSQMWKWLYNIEFAPDWFRDIATNALSSITEFEYVIDEDLAQHVDTFRTTISKNRRVVLVPHSQGNFYANNAYDAVNSPSMGIAAVATPAGRVAGNGPYTTLTSDLIIQASIILNLTRLPANTTNSNPGTSQGHDFVADYLYGIQSGRKISQDILNHINTLPSPCDAPEILSISVPETIPGTPGTRVEGDVTFRDRNGDVIQYCETVVSGVANTSGCRDIENLEGVTEGSFKTAWECNANPGQRCTRGPVVIDAFLVDAAGNQSVPFRYTFTVTGIAPGKNDGTETLISNLK